MSVPLTITAHLSTPLVGVDRHDLMLDSPLSWAWANRAMGRGDRLPPITPTFAADFPLPLDRWEKDGAWGWCCSAGVLDIAAYTGVQVRRKPAVDAMARYAPDRKHHAGLGPYKARDTTLGAVLAKSVTWEALVTDRADLEDLLGLVTQLGARHRNGFGTVHRWTVEDSHHPDGWRKRPMPNPNGIPGRTRAPYWHQTSRTLVA